MKPKPIRTPSRKTKRTTPAAVDSILFFDDGPRPYGVGYLKSKLVHWQITAQKNFQATPVTIKKAATLLAEMVRDAEVASRDGVCLQYTNEGQLQWFQDVRRALN